MNYEFLSDTNIGYEGNYWCGTPTDDKFGCNHIHFNTNESNVKLK